MSGDEVLVLVVALVAGPLAWGVWCLRLSRIQVLRRRGSGLGLLSASLAAAAALVFAVLTTQASHDVRDSAGYLVLYVVLGVAWIVQALAWLPLLGLSVRDDVVERGNPAALVAIAGAMAGTALAYAGGNIGDGPGWWVVVFCAALASAGLAAAWVGLARTGITEAVTIDRDLAAGFRLGGYLLACGAVLGRAVAGDWVSAGATLADFGRAGWPALGLLALAASVERAVQPTPARPRAPLASCGLLPAAFYLASAAAVVAWLGPAT